MKAAVPILALSALAACAVPSPRIQAQSQADLRASDAVADQVRRCYRAPRIPSAGRRIVTRLLVEYGPDGTLVGLPILVSQQGVTPEIRPYSGPMAEAARSAVIRCAPVRLPDETNRRRTSLFYLTFSPQLRA